MDTAGEAAEAEDEAERPKKKAATTALQKKVALLHHQLEGTNKGQEQLYHMVGKLSSQWSRKVLVLVPM
eukprot:9489196-Prorocentrum_lima.AAC.1